MRSILFSFLLCGAVRAQAPDTDWGRVRAYCSAGVMLSRDEGRFSRQTPYLAFNLDKNWRQGDVLLVNSFFETRLTAIPVGARAGEMASSEKAAQMNAGIYLPVLTTRWTAGGRAQSLFVAPLAKLGMETPVSERVDRFYTASGGGARLGHFMGREADAAPELVSYIDFLWGRYASLDPSRRRLGIEGVLKAPGAPVVVGFTANLGRSGGTGRDDLRFFFGTRFDLGSLLARLKAIP
jgi:hypothetical protein